MTLLLQLVMNAQKKSPRPPNLKQIFEQYSVEHKLKPPKVTVKPAAPAVNHDFDILFHC